MSLEDIKPSRVKRKSVEQELFEKSFIHDQQFRPKEHKPKDSVVCTITRQARSKSNLLRYSDSMLLNDQITIPTLFTYGHRFCSKSD